MTLQVEPLTPDDIEKLIDRAAKRIGFKGKLTPFFEGVVQWGNPSPGILLNAFEKFAAGIPIKKALKTGDAALDYITVARAFVAGDWRIVRGFLATADTETGKGFRLMLLAYMRTMLLNGKSSTQCAAAMREIGVATPYDDTFNPWFAATLYTAIKHFKPRE
jgi:hypothetical protein